MLELGLLRSMQFLVMTKPRGMTMQGHDWLRQVEEIRREKENLEAMFWELAEGEANIALIERL